jgi:hypothetical protein
MVEPDEMYFEIGKRNFVVNGMTGDFTKAKMGDGGIALDNFMREKGIDFVDILHADIQGAELQMLHGAEKSISEGNIGYIFLSTHSQQLHHTCLSYLRDHRYTIIASADFDNETSCYDGVLVARFSGINGLDPMNIALRGRNEVSF